MLELDLPAALEDFHVAVGGEAQGVPEAHGRLDLNGLRRVSTYCVAHELGGHGIAAFC